MATAIRTSVWRRVARGAAALVLCASGAAQAAIVNFSGEGYVAPMDGLDFNPGVFPWKLGARSYDPYDLGGDPLNFVSVFEVQFDFSTGTPIPTGGTGDFQFNEVPGTDSLFGTVTTTATATGFLIDYVVTSGGGIYSGVTGTGQSNVVFLVPPVLGYVDRYRETGFLDLNFPAQVPEPSSAALLLAAALGAAAVRRRGKADEPQAMPA